LVYSFAWLFILIRQDFLPLSLDCVHAVEMAIDVVFGEKIDPLTPKPGWGGCCLLDR
jgi:hypothetical protein